MRTTEHAIRGGWSQDGRGTNENGSEHDETHDTRGFGTHVSHGCQISPCRCCLHSSWRYGLVDHSRNCVVVGFATASSMQSSSRFLLCFASFLFGLWVMRVCAAGVSSSLDVASASVAGAGGMGGLDMAAMRHQMNDPAMLKSMQSMLKGMDPAALASMMQVTVPTCSP